MSVLIPAAAISLLVMVSGSAARGERRGACDPGVETADGNPAPGHRPSDLFVGHRVLLVGARAPKTNEFVDRPGGWWWLKTLAVVRGTRAVTLSVPRSERKRLHLRYGGGAQTVTFRPCTRPARQWSYYPGGFTYSERGCYAVDLRIEGMRPLRRHIPLGVGARCSSP
jgi:hypothetical protein